MCFYRQHIEVIMNMQTIKNKTQAYPIDNKLPTLVKNTSSPRLPDKQTNGERGDDVKSICLSATWLRINDSERFFHCCLFDATNMLSI
jgi:hypothetical protein